MTTVWLSAALALTITLLPCGWVAFRRRAFDGLVAMELAGVLATLILVCLAVGFQRSSYAGVPLLAAFVTWVSGLVFVRFMDRRP